MARHCGYCYQRGHNRRSCPEIKKQIAENPSGYQARMVREKKEHAARNPRRCSYCHEPGHNKKTCTKLRTDRIETAVKIRSWRGKFLQRCQTMGFGVGTLLKFRDASTIQNDWQRERMEQVIDKHGVYAIVTQLKSDALDHRNLSRSQTTMLVRFPSGKTSSFQLPVEFVDLLDEYAAPQFEIAAKINAAEIGQLFDSVWHLGQDTTDYHLRI